MTLSKLQMKLLTSSKDSANLWSLFQIDIVTML